MAKPHEIAGILNCAPEKRSYWSIINDYDINTAVCELIDNPIDLWGASKTAHLEINIDIDQTNGTLVIDDNSGGIRREDLQLVVQPGASANSETDATIGIFGVGSKRSVVALAKKVSIVTHARRSGCFTLEYGDDWLNDPKWELPFSRTDNACPEGHTRITLSQLRVPITDDGIQKLKTHLGETYARFLSNARFSLKVGGESITAVAFENWAFPEEFEPRKITGKLKAGTRVIEVEAIGGLINEAAYSSGEYGVYFYLNNRLIAKGLKVPEVGFTKGLAGVPHHSHSIARVIVSLHGPARWMPWNSSKSGIHFGHETYKKLQELIQRLTTNYAKIATRLLNRWDDEVFPAKTGKIEAYDLKDFSSVNQCPLPAVPKVRPNLAAAIAEGNRPIVAKKPWAQTLVDGVILIDAIQRQKSDVKLRLAVVMLDTIVDLAVRDFFVYEDTDKISPDEWDRLLRVRDSSLNRLVDQDRIPKKLISTLQELRELREKLTLTRDPVELSGEIVERYRDAVQVMGRKLYGLRFPERRRAKE